jgi:hypothetical protein
VKGSIRLVPQSFIYISLIRQSDTNGALTLMYGHDVEKWHAFKDAEHDCQFALGPLRHPSFEGFVPENTTYPRHHTCSHCLLLFHFR